jgi:hypothetical protein
MTGRLLIAMAILAAERGEDPAPSSVRPPDRPAYEAARKEAGRDAKSQIGLALWCEAHGMTAERMKHLAAAVLQDPSNALARGLMGLIAHDGKWERPEDIAREAKQDPKRQALMQEYLERRAKAPDKADEQWKLALWCDQYGLKEQAIAHFHAVLRLDSRREGAWRHLGFKKVGGRWVKPEWQEAARLEADEQGRANKRWKPILERWRTGLSSRDRARRAEAEAGLTSVTDPRAVPMVWAVFVSRGAEGQKAAVRVLGQIDAPGSSRALAMLALSSKSAEARGEAIQILRRRDSRDFAPILVAMIRDPIKYEVKRVNGPGTTGELVIHDGTTNRKRLYSPPPAPSFMMGPNDYLSQDASGLPVIVRDLGLYQAASIRMNTSSDAAALAMLGMSVPTPAHLAGLLQRAGLPPALSQALGTNLSRNASASISVTGDPRNNITANISNDVQLQIPIGRMQLEAERAAQAAEVQLAGDVRAIEAYNGPIRDANRLARQVLSDTAGCDFGDDHSAWAKWLVDLFGYAYSARKSSSGENTVVEQVPLEYQPQPIPIDFVAGPPVVQLAHTHSCFGAGTMVRTLDGLHPIETLRPGDLVLTQDPRSGELKYQAIVTVYHNPPNATYRVALETGESIVATGIHRLWVAGKGWAMTRELKLGDVLRTLGGVATVKSVELDRTQPVYNLQVADGESYFVGRSGVLAHDNSTINPVPEPFDAAAPSTGATTSGRPAKTQSMLGR